MPDLLSLRRPIATEYLMAPHYDRSDDQPFDFDDPGQREKFDKLKAAMTKAIRKTLSSRWSGPERALAGVSVEDVRQEALLRVSRNVGSFKGGSFTAFATTIAHNAAVDVMRRLLSRKRGRGRVLSTDSLASDGDSNSTPEIPSSVNVEAEAIAVVNLEALSDLADQVLKRDEREVFWAYVYYRLTREEIATERGVSPQRVSQLKTSAIRKLKNDPRYPF